MRVRLAAFIGTGIAILLAWQLLIKSSLDREYKQTLQQTHEAETRLAEFSLVMAQLPNTLADGGRLKESKLHLQSSLYAKDDILRLLDTVRAQATRQNLTITEIIPPVEDLLQLTKAASRPGEPLFLNLTLRLEGDYVDFGTFVGYVESAPYFRRIRNCEIGRYAAPGSKTSFSIGFAVLLLRTEEA